MSFPSLPGPPLQIYHDKIEADTVDDGNGQPRAPMPTYLYDWFLHKYDAALLGAVRSAA